MTLNTQNILYIAELGQRRKELLNKRFGIKESYSSDELVAKTEYEVELFDSIDSLTPKELNDLIKVVEIGGFKINSSLPLQDKVNLLYNALNLYIFIEQGISQ